MALIYLAGLNGNIITGAESITPTSENTNFPEANLRDGLISRSFKFNAAAADDDVVVDLNHCLGGDMETWGVATIPDNWTDRSTGDGAISEEVTIVNGGSSSAKLVTTTGTAVMTQDITVKAGSAWSITGALYEAGNDTIRIRVQNLETGSYLTSGEAWQAGSTDWFTRTAASWSTSGPSTFTVEAYSVGLRAEYTIRVMVTMEGGSGEIGYVDDLYLWPHWDFAAVMGHNLGGMITATAQSDDNSGFSSATTQITFTVARPHFYGEPSAMVTERYLRFNFAGTNHTPIALTELVAGQKVTGQTHLLTPFTGSASMANTAEESRAGQVFRKSLADNPREGVTLAFLMTQAQYDTYREELLLATKYGQEPVVLVPDDSSSDVYFALPAPEIRWTHPLTASRQFEFEHDFIGGALPVRVGEVAD